MDRLNLTRYRLLTLTTMMVAIAILTSCVEKVAAPLPGNLYKWQTGGFIKGQLNGFLSDSLLVNENYNYTEFLDPLESHFRIDTIDANGKTQPLYIFDLKRFDSKSGSYVHLRFGLDSLGGRVRRPSGFYPQYGEIDFESIGPKNSILTYKNVQQGIYGQQNDVILFSDIIYNKDVNRILGSYTFRQYLGMRDTSKVYGPEVRGNFDMFVRRKLR